MWCAVTKKVSLQVTRKIKKDPTEMKVVRKRGENKGKLRMPGKRKVPCMMQVRNPVIHTAFAVGQRCVWSCQMDSR